MRGQKGWKMSGVVTFKNAKEPKNVASNVDLDLLLVETDCPYLAPVPNRGKLNEPAFVSYVLDEVASLRKETYQEVKSKIYENSKRLFKI